jgi:dUTP pyrophosphatase
MFDDAIVPTFGSDGAAGADLYARIDNERHMQAIYPNSTQVISTGICMEIPESYVGLVFSRSGLATKQGLSLANCVGVIDSDYRGEIKIALHNHSDSIRKVKHGERVAQIVLVPFLKPTFHEQDSLSDTARGEDGFGSTGQ